MAQWRTICRLQSVENGRTSFSSGIEVNRSFDPQNIGDKFVRLVTPEQCSVARVEGIQHLIGRSIDEAIDGLKNKHCRAHFLLPAHNPIPGPQCIERPIVRANIGEATCDDDRLVVSIWLRPGLAIRSRLWPVSAA